MKRRLLILAVASILFALSGCDGSDDGKKTPKPDPQKDPRADVAEYTLRKVLQCDPVNVDGIDIKEKFNFFDGLKLTLYFVDDEVTALEFTNGDILPFYPYGFTVAEGKLECALDKSVEPNELRLTGTNELIAYVDNGELIVAFHLDSKLVTYKYTFKTVEDKL